MDVLALEPMVVVQPAGIDERHVALAVARDDLLGAGPDLFRAHFDPFRELDSFLPMSRFTRWLPEALAEPTIKRDVAEDEKEE